MKSSKQISHETKNIIHEEYTIKLNESELAELIYLLEACRGEWLLNDTTRRICKQLKEARKK